MTAHSSLEKMSQTGQIFDSYVLIITVLKTGWLPKSFHAKMNVLVSPTLSIMTLSIMTLRIATFSMVVVSIIKLSIMTLHNYTQHNGNQHDDT
jgi:hypothetical protein